VRVLAAERIDEQGDLLAPTAELEQKLPRL
jgi:hypothetical protein